MKTQKKMYSDYSSRLQYWDYSKPGFYFVTMVIRGRKRCFGEIRNGQMHLSPLGEFAEQSWKNTASLRPGMNIRLDAFAVMPDHFHALLFIGHNEYNTPIESPYEMSSEKAMEELMRPKNGFRSQSNNLASIVRGFKASVTTEARRLEIPFEGVSRYHDSIIRTVGDLHAVRSYILTNAQRWKE
jgi:putative transposase